MQKTKINTTKIILNLIDDRIDLQNTIRQKDLSIFDLQQKLNKYEGELNNVRAI